MTTKHLTIIGAGPKAVAIAAKRQVLADLGVPVPDICVVDGRGIGANWTGDHGYTNGELPLGTCPEKDVGYPYAAACNDHELAHEVNVAMLKFSWAAFHVLDSNHSYSEWVDRGKPNPRHRHWAEYLQWVANQVDMNLQPVDLKHAEIADGRWQITLSSEAALETDALVITSPGPARKRILIPTASERILNGCDFWLRKNRSRIEKQSEEKPEFNACVIGNGETAAAIVVELNSMLPLDTSSISVISKEGIIYTRGESYEENRLYSSPEIWREFSEDARRKFVERTDRGVFSVGNKALLNRAESVVTVAGRVTKIEAGEDDIAITLDDGSRRAGYDLVVDATGFQVDWFYDCLGEEALHLLNEAIPGSKPQEGTPERLPRHDLSTNLVERLTHSIGLDLSVDGLRPALHLPMLAALRQGPGFPNLSCLGLLSDRILQSHCDLLGSQRRTTQQMDDRI